MSKLNNDHSYLLGMLNHLYHDPCENDLEILNYLEGLDVLVDQKTFQMNSQKTVVVGMSGGVDSSVAALLLKLQGFHVIGIFMKNWDETDSSGQCPAELDYQDVVKVCERIGIPYYSFNFVKEYWDNVFSEFLEKYEKGLTPNPDILCNREIKFKVFYDRAKLLGADFLATGHYCQTQEGKLLKAIDQNKDQTYFLYAVEKKVFQDVIFPIGHLPKRTVRQIAEKFHLTTSHKKDSTGICFIGERNFKNFLSQYIQKSQGDFVDLDGRVIGQHDGMCFYTLGQRKGLGVGGPGGPWFVVGKNKSRNQVVLAQGSEHAALYSDELTCENINWLIQVPMDSELNCHAKIRYRQSEEPCRLIFSGDERSQCRVIFLRPQRAITPEQSVVFYLGQVCIGGGVITGVSPSYYHLGRSLP